VCEITIEYKLLEWLPMYGRKVRLYHHGMDKQCNSCNEIGHMKQECKGTKINWHGNVQMVRKTGRFEDLMLGFWLEDDKDKMESSEGDVNGDTGHTKKT
jgi:hypothetical protein